MRNGGIDLLRGIAAFNIVGCHLALLPITDDANLVLHFCDFNVAVFAVLAGLVMQKRSSEKCEVGSMGGLGYAVKRTKRILPVYVVWSAVFVLASVGFQLFGSGVETRFFAPSYWVDVVFRGGASCHLWFLICLLYAQIVIVFLDRWMSRWVWLVMGVAFVTVASCGNSWWHLYLMRLFGFLCVGKGLREVVSGQWLAVRSLRLLLFTTVLALLAHVLLASYVHGFIRDLIAAIPLVLLFKTMGESTSHLSPLTPYLSGILGTTSMAVFLVHPIITRVGSVIVGKTCAAPYSAGVVFADWVACWVLALCFALVAIRIPYLRRVCR